MLISLNWLKEYVYSKVDVPTLAERLTLAGSEVDRIAEQEVDFDGVVVAEVKGLRPLPGPTKTRIRAVTTGGAAVEVVTGAWNIAVGDRVPYATPGSRLGDRRIETKTFLGFPSAGMLCSAIELGLGEDAAGILVLDPGATPGQDLHELYPRDTILELEIKSNRPDLLCHLGIAREVAAIFNLSLREPKVPKSRTSDAPDLVRIDAPDGCRRFVGRLVTGVTVAPSPPWMQARLRAAGVRPISNVVDITNYVMLETGQPMHGFDYQRLKGGRSRWRRERRPAGDDRNFPGGGDLGAALDPADGADAGPADRSLVTIRKGFEPGPRPAGGRAGRGPGRGAGRGEGDEVERCLSRAAGADHDRGERR